MASSSVGGDGLGDYATPGGASANVDSNAMKARVDAIAAANSTATQVSQAARATAAATIYSLFGARTADDRQNVDMVLVYYFAVHGTSPDTEWTAYGVEYPIVANGKSVRPGDVVNAIGASRLKKYMGYYSSLAMQMVHSSPVFAAAMGERAARAGLATGQEHLAIDYVGKDGSLSAAEYRLRVASRDRLLNHRSRNALNLSAVRADAQSSTTNDARGLERPTLSFD